MIYEISGRYGSFTLEAESDLIAITATYLLTSDGSSFVKQPSLNQPTYFDKDFVKNVNALYSPKDQKEYVKENRTSLIETLKNYLPGTRITREETSQIISEFEESERDNMFKVLRQTYMKDVHFELDDRIKKVIAILNYDAKTA